MPFPLSVFCFVSAARLARHIQAPEVSSSELRKLLQQNKEDMEAVLATLRK
jgi:hypothetical protein